MTNESTAQRPEEATFWTPERKFRHRLIHRRVELESEMMKLLMTTRDRDEFLREANRLHKKYWAVEDQLAQGS